MTSGDLSDFDFTGFWRDSDYARKHYTEPTPDGEAVAAVEIELGVKLPAAYLAMAHSQNGGYPANDTHPAPSRTTWAENHVALNGIFAIGFREYSLCGSMGSRFWTKEWGYPDGLVYFADCPSAGHDMIGLNYRICGPGGAPSVVHVDQEVGYRMTEIAPDFGSFVRGLVPGKVYD